MDLIGGEELDRITAAELIPTLEWAALFYQATIFLISALIDPYSMHNRLIVGVLGLAHLALLPAYLRGRGPFARGGRWIGLAMLQCVAATVALAGLATPGTWGHAVYAPGSGYSNGFWVLLSGYPWTTVLSTRGRVTIEVLAVVAFSGFYWLVAVAVNGGFEPVLVRAAGVNLGWTLTGYVMGKAAFSLTRRVAGRHAETQRRNYTEFFDFLHSHVKASLAAMRLEADAGSAGLVAKVDDLATTVSDYRVRLLLAQDRVSVATLISESIRVVRGPLAVEATPRVGSLTVSRARGVVIGRAIADLLKNCLEHGARKAAISCTVDKQVLRLVVEDDGPGFDGTAFDDPGRSLHRLRAAARELAGEVHLLASSDLGGAAVGLTLPLHTVAGRR